MDGAGNLKPFGMWSDGATMWVADGADKQLYAYDRSTKVRQPEREISLAALDWVSLDLDPTGMWTDGVTIWVAAATDESPGTISVRAVNFADGTRHASKDIPVATAGSDNATGLWSDGETMLVADEVDRKVYSFNMPAASDDADLSALTVSPKNINGFAADRDSYEVGVASTVDEATIAATANDAGASVVITPPDSNDVTDDHQAALSAGKNPVTITVTAEDGSTVKAYTVNINQGVDTAYGWKASDDFDTLVAAVNEFPSGLWSDGTTMWVADFSADRIFAYRMSNRSEQISGEFDVLAGNTSPSGIWSDGTTMWIADGGADKLSAYRMSNKQHDDTKDFNTLIAAGNTSPAGIWSDGATMWVADLEDDKLFAYRMSDRERDPDRDFDTLADAGNNDPYGVWSDGTTMWVADYSADKIFAYRMSDRERDPDRDFDTPADAGNNDLSGIWSDGTTMWVADFSDDKIYSYNMPASNDADLSALTLAQGAGTPAEIAEFDRYTSGYTVNVPNDIEQVTVAGTKSHAQATGPVITPADAASGTDGHQVNLAVGDTAITFVVTAEDGSTNTYTVTVNRRLTSADATLSALTVSPKNIIGFDADRTSYQVGVASTVAIATVTPTVNHPGAGVAYTPDDADDVTPGHQVALVAGRNAVTITVTAEDSSTQDYTVSVNRGVTTVFGWNAEHDLDGLIAAGTRARHLWTNGTSIWVVDGSTSDPELHAYNTDGSRDSARDFTTLEAAGNVAPTGIWSNGTTMWVADISDDEIFAYNVSTKARDPDKDFDDLDNSNVSPTGIWSDRTTMWVADSGDDKIFAYNLNTEVREVHNEFNTLKAAANNSPGGIWSDGETMWVADVQDDKIYAYNMGTKNRDQAKEFNPLMAAGQDNVFGITSNSTTMWVSHVLERKIYSYNLPSSDATLSALTVSPRDIIGFDADQQSYEVGVDSTVAQATVTATPNDANARVSYSGTDADDMTDGHQVDLSAGRNQVTVTATAENGSTQDYTISINRGVGAQYGWKAGDDLDSLIAAGNRSPRGIWANSTTLYISDFSDQKVYAYNRDGTRDDSKDLGVSNFPNGIWSDGTTLWVADSAAENLIAYTLSNGNRNTGADIALSNRSQGVWGNSTTVWAVNETTDKLEAYQRSDGSEDNDKDIALHSDNGDPAGIWSDGTTMWVADHGGDKLYAYTLSGGVRDTAKDIDTSGSGNASPRGLWGDEETIWVTSEDDDKVYSYNLPRSSDDATLSALTVTPTNITGFRSDKTSYRVALASTVEQVTVAATANHESAGSTITPEDAEDMVDGHQVDLSAGANTVTIRVTAENTDTKDYTINIYRGDLTTEYAWRVDDDINTLAAADNIGAGGIWSDGTHAWIADEFYNKLFAYDAGTHARVDTQDFGTLQTAGNLTPAGIWSDGVTMWVADTDRHKLYAYKMSDKTRDETKDFNTLHAAGNDGPYGIWSDGVTMWVSDIDDDKLYAYRMSDRERDGDRDFDTPDGEGNTSPRGIWSDGDIMWVTDAFDGRVYAYRMSDQVREQSKEFNTLSMPGNERPNGMWSDETIMWVVEGSVRNSKVYSYNLPASANANLSAITLAQGTGAAEAIPEFDPGTTGHDFRVSYDTEQVTVAGTAGHAQATGPVITPADADPVSDGHQVNLPVGDTAITLVVTAEDGSTRTYTVTVKRGLTSDDATLSALTVSPRDIIGFAPGRRLYDVGVGSTVTEATVAATANDANATAVITPLDSNNGTDGHQVALSAGRNTVTITVTAEDAITTKTYTVGVNRSVAGDYAWRAEDDLDGLEAAGNDGPSGIWANSTTIWVVDGNDEEVYTYNHDGTRDAAKGFDLDSGNQAGKGAWTDGETVWIADTDKNKLYVYEVVSGTRQTGREFDLDTDNQTATGVWSDGTTIWVADSFDNKLYAYLLDGGTRQAGDDIALATDNTIGTGIWSDGTTIWVSERLGTNPKLFAYLLEGGSRVAAKDFNTLEAAGASLPSGLWSDGETMWVADQTDANSKVYAFNMPPSNDPTLSSLTVSPKDIIGFDPDRGSYEVGVTSSVATATITPASNHPDTTFTFSADDADPNTPGHQVSLSVGRNPTTITVTSEDRSVSQDYTVTINRGVGAQYGWKASDDLDGLIAAENRGPRGIWANSSTFFVADFTDDKVYAYNRDGTRDADKDFDVSNFPNGIWSDGTTLWVADSAAENLIAYTLSNGNRNTGADIALSNRSQGVWGNSTTVWAVNETTDKLEAYQKSDGSEDNDKDISLHSDNADPAGIWSDGTTMWVADHQQVKLFAYTLADGNRDSAKDIDTSPSGNASPRGLWGDEETIWVTSEDDDKVYSYNLQDNRSADATLSALTVSPRDIIGFESGREAYEVGVASTVAQATVIATTNHPSASVAYSGTDADLNTAGHQVDLSAGRNQVTITVTAEDTTTAQGYTVSINKGVTADYGWKASDDLDGLFISAFDAALGIAEDNGIFWISSSDSRNILAYRQDGSRASSRDITAHSANNDIGYLWTDSQTIWVSDFEDDRLYAYRLSDGSRQTSREFDLHTDNASGIGFWSDGTIVWVADSHDNQVYAYTLDDGTRQESKEFDLDRTNERSVGIWSDGYTVWVADSADGKLYAYGLQTGERQASRDFNTPWDAGNRNISGITSSGRTMWVVDSLDKKVYSYNMPLSADTTLSALTVSPRNIIGFDANRTSYEVGVASSVSQATVTASANHAAASVTFTHRTPAAVFQATRWTCRPAGTRSPSPPPPRTARKKLTPSASTGASPTTSPGRPQTTWTGSSPRRYSPQRASPATGPGSGSPPRTTSPSSPSTTWANPKPPGTSRPRATTATPPTCGPTPPPSSWWTRLT